MPDHTRAIVPIEAWAYASPDVTIRGDVSDAGLFAEALLYHDVVGQVVTAAVSGV